MPKIHIVTDSCAHFANPHFVQQNPVTVVPNKIEIGGKVYREGVDLSAEEALTLISRQQTAPKVTAPTVAEYAEVYTRLGHHYDAIISIHASREIYPSWNNARIAAQPLMGHSEIIVIDSQMLCVAQGMLVRAAVRTLQQEDKLEDIVRQVRGAIDRIYVMYCVESVDFLLQNNIMTPSHSILGAMLGIKPFLTIEGGHLIPVEKVKTRAQVIERLVEFAVEFTDIEETVILQHKASISEQARALQDRLTQEFPRRLFPFSLYGASMAALIGADATGVVILESEPEEFYDDL